MNLSQLYQRTKIRFPVGRTISPESMVNFVHFYLARFPIEILKKLIFFQTFFEFC